MKREPLHPLPDPAPRAAPLAAPLAYSSDPPRRATLHLWIGAASAMLLEVPWAYAVGAYLWDPMDGDSGLASARGVLALLGLSLPSLIAAILVLLAVRRS